MPSYPQRGENLHVSVRVKNSSQDFDRIPGIVNNFISLFKDTSLVYIVGMKDLLDAVKTKNDTALEWQSAQTATTGYAFAAMVFWIFCFSMSRYSMFMERRLNTGHKR